MWGMPTRMTVMRMMRRGCRPVAVRQLPLAALSCVRYEHRGTAHGDRCLSVSNLFSRRRLRKGPMLPFSLVVQPFSTNSGDAANNKANGANSNEDKEARPKSHMRELWDKYGWCGIGTYAAIDVVTLGSFYAAILYGVDVEALLTKLRVLELMETIGMGTEVLNSNASKFFTAWALYSAVAPVRFGLTFALTPLVSRYFSFKKAKKEREQEAKKTAERESE